MWTGTRRVGEHSSTLISFTFPSDSTRSSACRASHPNRSGYGLQPRHPPETLHVGVCAPSACCKRVRHAMPRWSPSRACACLHQTAPYASAPRHRSGSGSGAGPHNNLSTLSPHHANVACIQTVGSGAACGCICTASATPRSTGAGRRARAPSRRRTSLRRGRRRRCARRSGRARCRRWRCRCRRRQARCRRASAPCPRARLAPRAARTRPSARPARAAPALSRPALRNCCKAFPWDRRGSVRDQPRGCCLEHHVCATLRALSIDVHGASLSDD